MYKALYIFVDHNFCGLLASLLIFQKNFFFFFIFKTGHVFCIMFFAVKLENCILFHFFPLFSKPKHTFFVAYFCASWPRIWIFFYVTKPVFEYIECVCVSVYTVLFSFLGCYLPVCLSVYLSTLLCVRWEYFLYFRYLQQIHVALLYMGCNHKYQPVTIVIIHLNFIQFSCHRILYIYMVYLIPTYC